MTRASDLKPVRRIVRGPDGDLVLELRERTVTLKPPRVRDPSARVELTWAAVYQLGLTRRGPR